VSAIMPLAVRYTGNIVTIRQLALLASVCWSVGCATASRSSCVGSYERGIRGEVMKAADGRTLYFNGQCWTRQSMPPTDLPLERPTMFDDDP
jgi:hypothetical protein